MCGIVSYRLWDRSLYSIEEELGKKKGIETQKIKEADRANNVRYNVDSYFICRCDISTSGNI